MERAKTKGRRMPRGGKREGAGRPKKSPEDVASVYIPIHMTRMERELCQEAADSERLPLSGWGRKHLLRRARKSSLK